MAQTETLEILRKFPNGVTLIQLHSDDEIRRKVLSRDLYALKKWRLVERIEGSSSHDVLWRALTQEELDAFHCIVCGRAMLQPNKKCGSCRRKNQ